MAIIEQRLTGKFEAVNRKLKVKPGPDGLVYSRRSRKGEYSLRVSLEPNTGETIVSAQRPNKLNPAIITVEKHYVPKGTDFSITVPELRRRIIITG